MLLPPLNSLRPAAPDASPESLGGGIASLREERQRQRIVSTVFVVFGLLVTEGILRKWVLPSYSHWIYFIRDPFVLWVYAYAFLTGQWPRRQPLLTAGLTFAVVALLIAAIQLVIGSPLGSSAAMFAGYGWRNYFFYIPLAFIIGVHFRAEDLQRFARLTLLMAIPSAVLVYLQFHSPIDATINVGIAEDIALQFHGLGLDGDHVRPMGSFTADSGQGHFTMLAVTSAMMVWGAGQMASQLSRMLATIGTLAALVCLAYSGSRGAVLGTAIILLAALAAIPVLDRTQSSRRLFVAVCGMLVALAVVAIFFATDGLQAFLNRWEAGHAGDSTAFSGGIFGRALYGFIDFARLMFSSPLLGYGLGIGGNASTTLGVTIQGVAPLELAETDWARHILDLGPVFGLLFIVFRVCLTAWLGWRVIRSRTLSAYLLFALVALDLLYGQITGQGTLNGFGWINTGLCLAATYRQQQPSSAGRLTAASAPRFTNVLR